MVIPSWWRPGREDGAKRFAAVVAVASDPSPPSAGGGAPAPVAVVMGSDSDLPTLQPAVAILRELGVACEVRVLSAHRTPLEMVAFAEAAAARGLHDQVRAKDERLQQLGSDAYLETMGA